MPRALQTSCPVGLILKSSVATDADGQIRGQGDMGTVKWAPLQSMRTIKGLAILLVIAPAGAHAADRPGISKLSPLQLAQAQMDGGRGLGPDRVLRTEPEEPSIEDLAARLNRSERILGGTQAKPGQWPSMVAIYMRNANGRAFPFCGGTVIAKNWVLTAAHCAAAMQRSPDARYFIREGSVNLNSGARGDVPVSRIIAHEKYIPKLTLNDVALLQLGGAANSPPQALVGQRQAEQLLTPRRMTTVIGFGVTSEDGSASANLLQVDVPLVSRQDCQRVYSSDSITDANFCAGTSQGGRDSCQGDSGGPTYIPTAGGKMAQVGVVSWGRGCGRPGVPGVYASVGRFEDWIRSKVRDAVFVGGKSDESVPPAEPPATNQALQTIANGATTTDKPSQLAQLTVDIVQGNRLKVGDAIDIRVLSSVDGTLALFNEEAGKRAYQIFPTPAMTSAQPGSLDRIVAGQPMTLPPPRLKDSGFRFRITPPVGQNRLVAVVIPAGVKVGDILSRHADGSDFYNLDDVLTQLATAAMRGIEVVQLPPVNRATATWNYEIIE